MSYPYPQDRHLDRKEKGQQPYKDAREAMTQKDAKIQAEAEEYGETRFRESDEERAQRIEAESEDRLRQVGDEVGRRGHDETADMTDQH